MTSHSTRRGFGQQYLALAALSFDAKGQLLEHGMLTDISFISCEVSGKLMSDIPKI